MRSKIRNIGLAALVATSVAQITYKNAFAQSTDTGEQNNAYCRLIDKDISAASLIDKLEPEVGDFVCIEEQSMNPVYQPDVFSEELHFIFSDFVQSWSFNMYNWIERYVPEGKELDPNLLATIMQTESNGFRDVESPAGAMGLFQVMPYHFDEGENPYNPDTNARAAITYLMARLDQSEGDVVAALAGYNGGQRATEWFMGERTREEYVQIIDEKHGVGQGEKSAQEVERYVERCMNLYEQTLIDDKMIVSVDNTWDMKGLILNTTINENLDQGSVVYIQNQAFLSNE